MPVQVSISDVMCSDRRRLELSHGPYEEKANDVNEHNKRPYKIALRVRSQSNYEKVTH